MAALPIRPRTAADVAAVAGLLRETHHSDGYPKIVPPDMEAWAAADDVIAGWVAVDRAGEVVGHVLLTETHADEATDQWVAATGLPAGALAAVRRLVVHRSAQRTGTGRALLATAVDAAHARGRRPVLDMSDNLAAAGELYASAGFERVGAYDLDLGGQPLHVFTWVGPEVASGREVTSVRDVT